MWYDQSETKHDKIKLILYGDILGYARKAGLCYLLQYQWYAVGKVETLHKLSF